MKYTTKDFQIIADFLDNYGIFYTQGNYYDINEKICGHWMKINDDLETDDLNQEDFNYNNGTPDNVDETNYNPYMGQDFYE